MSINSASAEVTQIGIETAGQSGVAVPAKLRARSIAATFGINYESMQLRPEGAKLIAMVIPLREWNAFGVSGSPTYTEMMIWLSAALGEPVTNEVTAGVYDHVWEINPAGAQNPRTLTLEKGSSIYAERSVRCALVEFTQTFSRTEIAATGAGIGEAVEEDVSMSTNEVQTLTITGGPTGGTFTLTWDGQTTAGIAHNATASTIQTALEALSNIIPGDVVCTGGPLPAAVAVEFTGRYRQENVGAITHNSAGLTGGSSPTVVVTQTTPGVPPTFLDLIPVLPGQGGIFIDTLYDDIGTTQIDMGFNAVVTIGNMFGAVWPIDNRLASFGGVVDLTPNLSVALTLEKRPDLSQITPMREGANRYLRLLYTGAANAITSGYTYEYEIDAAGAVSAVGADGDTEGVRTREWTWSLIEDADIPGLRIRLRNDIESLDSLMA